MDWRTLPLAIDVSHHNGKIDWPRVAAQKPAAVFIKATERQWTDPDFERNRKGCEDHGIPWVPYVFLRPDDHERTMAYLIREIGDKSIPIALDWEAIGVSSGTVEAWIDAVEADGGRTPIAYYGLYPPAGATVKIARCPRWYAQYPGSITAGPRLPMWDGTDNPDWRACWYIWQWTDKGKVDGIPERVDLNRLAVSAEQFAAWYRQGLPARPADKRIPEIEAALAALESAAVPAQVALQRHGFYRGAVDGVWGPMSATAAGAYRASVGVRR